MTLLVNAYAVAFVATNMLLMAVWPKARCGCGRSILPYLPRLHETHGILIALAVGATMIPVLGIISRMGTFGTAGWAALAVWHWWAVKVHGKGRRKWPDKVAGLVRINEHGRLSIER